MALIKSISGIRGTIGGQPGDSLSPLDIVKFAAAYGTWLRKRNPENKKVVIGRDGRISGSVVKDIVIRTLNMVGLDVVDLDLSTTPTVEMAVKFENASGGIIITASHNPKEWNALKLLNEEGEFLSGKDGEELLELVETEAYVFVNVDNLGKLTQNTDAMEKHIEAVVNYPLVNKSKIEAKNFKVVVDGVNSSGSIFIPQLLLALGLLPENIIVLNKEVTGKFAHNPEPLPENLRELCNEVNKNKANLGIAIDPDVDRLCFVCEDGSMFGEEFTLVAVADYILQHKKGPTVSNLSSTRALRDVTEKHGCEYFASAVGEVNVVAKMKEVHAVIGGEGNGGIIVPDFHYGRDALIGVGLFLSFLADKKSAKQLRAEYPNYFISKNKIELDTKVNLQDVFAHICDKYKNNNINKIDGLKIEFDKDWVHLRPSNTEPIIRIYAESNFETTANNIAKRIMQDIKECM
ncbi:phosphoglucosamine mutase [Rhizosphaericola mali]|uniref:Phosphoglucosamine mutase n=1 Tax=Rhizosphaericola mali TaxID=2545455 RepID=A0A5P2FZU4_9BACT|nr:phosphoglucosamine mutase [Rhizosphaericola mali]QES89054.1 phosphoglucosamine mutase [Rhizosphaericola mali]